eukprot:2681834-Prymnesium_polylepis.2
MSVTRLTSGAVTTTEHLGSTHPPCPQGLAPPPPFDDFRNKVEPAPRFLSPPHWGYPDGTHTTTTY